MLDSVPPQLWILLVLAMIAIGPASYVWRHLAHAATPRDITQPPEDLSWRSPGRLYRCLAILAAMVAAAVFIFTPFAEDFARSDAFLPSALGAIGAYALSTVLAGWRNGRIEPLLRGLSQSYDRLDQPRRYWASLGWNAVLGSALVVASLGALRENRAPVCNDLDQDALVEALESCNVLLAEQGLDEEQRAELLAARGRVQHRLGSARLALSDYSAALDLAPDDSYTLYNRALIHFRLVDLPRAIEDLNASIALRPDNDDAYLKRGNAYLDTGRFQEAIEDFTTLHERDGDHPYALADRGMAQAWLDNRELAERDFARVEVGSTGWPVVLRGRAVLAMHREDHARVIDYLSQSLKFDPDNPFALRRRAYAYSQTGQADLARRDIDRAREVEAKLFPERVETVFVAPP